MNHYRPNQNDFRLAELPMDVKSLDVKILDEETDQGSPKPLFHLAASGLSFATGAEPGITFGQASKRGPMGRGHRRR